MQSPSKLLLTAACACGLLLAPGASALAQQDPARGGYSGQQPSAPLGDKKLNQFIDAYSEVQTIGKEFSAKVEGVQDRSKVHALQQEAQSDMIEAVRDAGLSVPEYNEIATMMEADPELRQQVIERVEQR
jgi:uncharacterized protein YqfA (UPF0365 family)